MSQQNVEIVERGWEHFVATGEPDWGTVDEDVEAYDHDIMDSSDYRGHAGLRRWLFEDWASAWSEWSAGPAEFIDADDQVVVAFHVKATGRGSGVEVERDDAMVFKLRDGKTVRIDYYNSKQQALEEVGLG